MGFPLAGIDAGTLAETMFECPVRQAAIGRDVAIAPLGVVATRATPGRRASAGRDAHL